MSKFTDDKEKLDAIDLAEMLTKDDAKLNENASEFIYWC